MLKPTVIAPQDLAQLREAMMRAQIAAMEADATRLRLFVRYGLGEHDTFDGQSGLIMRAPVDEPLRVPELAPEVPPEPHA
jgi:hypothetical protein